MPARGGILTADKSRIQRGDAVIGAIPVMREVEI